MGMRRWWVAVAWWMTACSGDDVGVADGSTTASGSGPTSSSGPEPTSSSSAATEATSNVEATSLDTTVGTSSGSSSSTGDASASSESGVETMSSDEESSSTGDGEPMLPSCPPLLLPLPTCQSDWGEDCNPLQQDCPAGQKCGFNEGDLVDWWNLEATCLNVGGAQAVGEPCSYSGGYYIGDDDCVADAWCNNVDADTLVGECVEFCLCDSPCDTPGTFCQQSGFPPYCGYMCNPLLGDDACEQGWYCAPEIGSTYYDSPGFFTCKPDYDPPDESWGDPCKNGTSALFDVPGCTQLCSTDGTYPCPGDAMCTGMETLYPACIPDLGACLPA